MLGKWLEFSVQSEDLLDSLRFYRALGFRELSTGDVWSHGYAVVSDGDLCIGLHNLDFDSPALTFVQPNLGKRARSMQRHGYEFTEMRLDEDVFNELQFKSLNGHTISMIEARTFSLPPEATENSLCGTFFELTLPAEDVVQSARFWAPLAPHVTDFREEPTTHLRFDAEGVPLGLSESIALSGPALCFKCHDRKALEAAIEQHGLRKQKFPGFEGAFAVLAAPEGTRLYLFDEDFLGESYEVSEEPAS
ncbi:MAG: hypothetical protein WBM54_12025 [Woeseia sp.]